MSVLRVLFVVGVLAVLLGTNWSHPGRVGSIGPRAAADSAACKRSAAPVRVRLSRRRYPAIVDHLEDVRSRYPRVWHIDRAGADENRRESLRGWPTRDGLDRDEEPPAVAREGGRGADIRYVESGENRSAGASLGGQLRGWCSGQAFRLQVK